MIKQQDRWIKFFSILLTLIISLTNIFTFSGPSYAVTKIEIISDSKDVFDLAYYDIWKHDDGTWQNGKKQGSLVSATFTIKESIVPDGAKITSITGSFDNDYSGKHLEFCVLSGNSNVSNIQYESSVGQTKEGSTADISYNVSTVLISNTGDDGEYIKKPDQTENVEGWRYYIPVTFHIEYTEEVEIIIEVGDFQPDLGLPSTAKQGETYSVMDDTTVDSNCTIDYATLEKHLGDSNWETVATWNGTGSAGQNTGKSKSESCDTICTVTYRLTVYDIYGKEKSVTKTISIQDNISVDAEADLELDEYTYEGHPAYARDVSVFDVDGETYNASRAYEKNVASNRFDVVENTDYDMDRLSDTKAKVIFEKAGNYHVQLRVRTKDGKKIYATEPIEVRKTPYIETNLGGTQKQNRKQVLNMSACIHPDYPVTNFWVEIEDVDTGEKVHLTSSKVNSTNIKTRDIQTNATEYYNNFTLEFLTKNTIGKVYKYTAYVKDSKGDTAKVTKTFTVHPDKAPSAVINLPSDFYRNEKTNIAEIIAEDKTVSSDGDQLSRTWKVAFDTDHDNNCNDEVFNNITTLGYDDLSFGTKQKVKFNKTGVGRVKLRLYLKEVWTEPTLEEYVTDSDRLTGYTYKITYVKNIAPMVSVEPINAYKEDILILTTENNMGAAEAKKSKLESYLKENTIDSHINIASFKDEDLGGIRKVLSLRQDVSYEDRSYAYTFCVDNKNVYRIKASSVSDTDGDGKRNSTPPYTVEAWEIEENKKIWSYTITKGDDDIELKQDNSDKYLFVILDKDETIILNKATGAYMTTLDFALYGNTYVTDDGIYWFNEEIKKIDLGTGNVSLISDNASTVSNIVQGKVHFVYSEKGITYRGILDLQTNSIDSQYLAQSGADTNYTDYHVKHIDGYGNIILYSSGTMKCYNIYNECVREGSYSIPNYRVYNFGAVKDESGVTRYMYAYGYDYGGKGRRRYKFKIYDIDSSYSHTFYYTYTNSNGMGGKLIFIKYDTENNDIYAQKEGDIEESGNRSSKGFWMDLDNNQIGIMSSIKTNKAEYGTSSDNYWATNSVDEDKDNGDQIIFVGKYNMPLQDTILRNLSKNAYFRNDYQKNIIIMDDVNKTNTTLMNKVIDTVERWGAKFTSVGKTITGNNYLIKMKDETDGNAIYYNHYNMDNNYINITNVISSNKEDIVSKVVKIKGQDNSSATITDDLLLDAGKNYVYEYDIKYINKGSMNTADIFDIEHDIQNIRSESQVALALPTGVKNCEKFNDTYDLNQFFNYSDLWNRWRYNERDDKLAAWIYKKSNLRTKSVEITFKTDVKSVLSFDYGYTEDGRKKFTTNLYATLDDIEIEDIMVDGEFEDEIDHDLHFNQIISPGNHKLYLSYRCYRKYPYHYAYIDNLTVRPVEFKTNGSYDTGTINKDMENIKEEEWQHISGEFRAPFEDSQYTKITTAQNMPSNYNSTTHFIANNYVYTQSKKFTGDSTLKLGYNSTSNSEFLIKNLKIYRLEDGKKILWKNYGVMTKEMLDEEFATNANRAQITIDNDTTSADEETPMIPIYAKGQLILYNVYYNDYENDPSKKQYWQYTHTPFNDGLHPEQGKILNAPIDRFWVDGKYELKHWQEDSTGVTAYDKVSNKEEITFYVQGNSTAAPEVTYIKTIPATVKEGQSYKVEIGVDDEDLDDLDTSIELYLNNQLIYTYNKNNVSAISNVYPPIVSGTAPKAEVGKYTIVATARDDTGVGMRSYEFTVVSEGKVEGEVHHVEQWDINRKKYNLSKTGDEEKPRGYNVFWSGERFVLRSETEGKPNRVHVEILNEGYETDLSSANGGDTWEGHIWDKSMLYRNGIAIVKWGHYAPETLTFRFTAYFDGGITRTHDVQVIVDNQDPYWKLRKAY